MPLAKNSSGSGALAKAMALVLVGLAPAGAAPTGGAGGPAMRLRQARPLRSAYRLEVREPPPPLAVDRVALVDGTGCPVEVRAIIRGDVLADDFAILGNGPQSVVATVGDGVPTRQGWFVVVSIAGDRVVLRRGGQVLSCALGDPETAVAPVRPPMR